MAVSWLHQNQHSFEEATYFTATSTLYRKKGIFCHLKVSNHSQGTFFVLHWMATRVSINCSGKISRECKSNHSNSHSFHIVQIMDKRWKLNMIKCRVYPMKVEETLFFCCVQPDKDLEYLHSHGNLRIFLSWFLLLLCS